jgi:hypothetical protein
VWVTSRLENPSDGLRWLKAPDGWLIESCTNKNEIFLVQFGKVVGAIDSLSEEKKENKNINNSSNAPIQTPVQTPSVKVEGEEELLHRKLR